MHKENVNSRTWSSTTILIGFLLLLMSSNPAGTRAQEPSAQPSANAMPSTYDLYNPAKTPGELLSEGTNAIPVGRLKVKTYRLEEVKLSRPFDLELRGRLRHLSSVLRLTVIGDSFRCGSYAIWIDETQLGDVSGGLNELTTIVFDRSLLEDGAAISVSCESENARSILPERLYVPTSARDTSPPVDDEGNTITRIRTVNRGDGLDVVEIALTSREEVEARNEVLIVQIGKLEFIGASSPNGDHHHLILRLTPEQFAQLRDNDLIRVKYGRGARGLRGSRSFGRLDKAMLKN